MTETGTYQQKTDFVSANTTCEQLQEIQQLMNRLEKTIHGTESFTDDIKNSCEYDISKSLLDYLPTPTNPMMRSSLNLRTVKHDLVTRKKFLGANDEIAYGIQDAKDIDSDAEFESMFAPSDMKLLALVSHNNMKHSMKEFVKANKNVLTKFRLTGTNTTMTMLKEVFGNDPDIEYGPSCRSGPLGGDAQLVAMAATGQLGGCIFFIDPMDSHPHNADIQCLCRQGNVYNILMMNNPTTAHMCLDALRVALKMGHMDKLPSFFFELQSSSVETYMARQMKVLTSNMHDGSSETKTKRREQEIVASMVEAIREKKTIQHNSVADKKKSFFAW